MQCITQPLPLLSGAHKLAERVPARAQGSRIHYSRLLLFMGTQDLSDGPEPMYWLSYTAAQQPPHNNCGRRALLLRKHAVSRAQRRSYRRFGEIWQQVRADCLAVWFVAESARAFGRATSSGLKDDRVCVLSLWLLPEPPSGCRAEHTCVV